MHENALACARNVIFEIGAGRTVPTAWHFGERKSGKLIRINPTGWHVLGHDAIGLQGRCAGRSPTHGCCPANWMTGERSVFSFFHTMRQHSVVRRNAAECGQDAFAHGAYSSSTRSCNDTNWTWFRSSSAT
jgi:hypothetical protein